MLNGEYEGFMQVEENKPTKQITTESQQSDNSTQTDEKDTSNMETQTETEKVDVATQTTTCYGCQVGHPSQIQHMEPGGCMYQEDSMSVSRFYLTVSSFTTEPPESPPSESTPDSAVDLQQPQYVQQMELSDISEPTPPPPPQQDYIETLQLSDISQESMQTERTPPAAPKKPPRKRLFSKTNLQEALKEMFGSSPTPPPKRQKTEDTTPIVISSDNEAEATNDWTDDTFYNVEYTEEVTHL